VPILSGQIEALSPLRALLANATRVQIDGYCAGQEARHAAVLTRLSA
jgi:hypothetical protein